MNPSDILRFLPILQFGHPIPSAKVFLLPPPAGFVTLFDINEETLSQRLFIVLQLKPFYFVLEPTRRSHMSNASTIGLESS